MHANAMRNLIRLAAELEGPVPAAAAAAVEQEMVVPGLLEAGLKAAGFAVEHTPLKLRHRCQVLKGGAAVARGISGDPADALLQAVHAFLKESE